MRHSRRVLLLSAALLAVLSGCGGSGASRSGTTTTAPVSLVMTATPPTAGVNVLSFEVTVTSALLAPGSAQLLTTPVTVEVSRLQAENALIGSANIPAGTYTSVALTFSSPSLTFQNTTGSAISIWGSASCAAGAICTVAPTLPANVTLTGTANLPGSGVTFTANSAAALLLNLNLSTLFANTTQANLASNSTITSITPSTAGAPLISMEDVVGTISAVNSSSNTFTLQNSIGTYTVSTATSVSPTVYSNFPSSGTCTSATFTCLAAGQIVSVNMSLQSGGTLLASDIFYEDASASEPEIEGIVVATTGLTAPVQFNLVVLQETPTVSGVPIGSVVGIAPNTSPAATFDIDNLGSSTSAYVFNSSTVIIGQELQVRVLPTSTTSRIDTDRVRLRSSRITATVSATSIPNFTISTLPGLFGTASITQIQVNTGSGYTEFSGTAVSATQIVVSRVVTVRGQLFANGSTPVDVATEVIQY